MQAEFLRDYLAHISLNDNTDGELEYFTLTEYMEKNIGKLVKAEPRKVNLKLTESYALLRYLEGVKTEDDLTRLNILFFKGEIEKQINHHKKRIRHESFIRQ